MREVAKSEGIPIEKMKFKREIFYFKHKGLKDEGWTDNAEVYYEN